MNVHQAHQKWTKCGEDDPRLVALSLEDKRGKKCAPEESFATQADQTGA
jgi:hypothetical protein